ncbi:MAG: hypothetical protein JO108_22400 [Acidobacteriaceae bacterium]|nr:hypothetical protein [Acidobacteriaceae bacterium]
MDRFAGLPVFRKCSVNWMLASPKWMTDPHNLDPVDADLDASHYGSREKRLFDHIGG